MTKERLSQIREHFQNEGKFAENIMDGGENYDGADGARSVLALWNDALELMEAVQPHCEPLPPAAGRESP